MLLNLNAPGKYPIPLFDVGEPHRFTYFDGLKRDSCLLSHNLCLSGHFGLHGHIVMFTQRCPDDNHMGSVAHMYRHDLTMDSVGPPAGGFAVWRIAEQQQDNDCE